MSTFMAKPAEVQRKWYIVDAANRPLGRTAAKVADLLRGKVKPTFTPNVDCGDHVIVINADKAVLTGRKLENKYYRRHTGYIGGLKEVKYSTLMKTRPELAMELAVKGMVPNTTIGRKALTRLHIYSGADYAQKAQKRTGKASFQQHYIFSLQSFCAVSSGPAIQSPMSSSSSK